MTPVEDKLLCESFPILYGQRHGSMRETTMYWGFGCGSGWFKVIYDLSAKLEAINVKLLSFGQIQATQVKEKFGLLRFYTDRSNKEVDALICEAERESSRTCEHCGKPGKLREGGWEKTLCDDCAKPATEEDLKDVREQLAEAANDPNLTLVESMPDFDYAVLDDLEGQQYFEFMKRHLGAFPVPKGNMPVG